MVNREISIENLPLELHNIKILKMIGNKIGKFVCVKKTPLKFSNHVLMENIDINIKKLENIVLKINNHILTFELSFYEGPIREDIPRKSSPVVSHPRINHNNMGVSLKFMEGTRGFTLEGFESLKIESKHQASAPALPVDCFFKSSSKDSLIKITSSSSLPCLEVGMTTTVDPGNKDHNLEDGEIRKPPLQKG